MEPVTQIELVDRHGRVIHQMPFDDGAFPLTIRLAHAAAEPIGPSLAPDPARWTDRGRALLTAAATAIVYGTLIWIHALSSSRGATVVEGTLMFMALIATYAGVWALGGRIAKHHASFARHFTWTCGVALVFTLLTYIASDALFFAPTPLTYLPVTLLWVAFGVAAVAGQLEIASSMSRSRRWRVAGVAVGCALGLALLGAYTDEHEFSTKLSSVGDIQPFSARLIPAESPDDFAKSLDGVKTKLDRAVAER